MGKELSILTVTCWRQWMATRSKFCGVVRLIRLIRLVCFVQPRIFLPATSRAMLGELLQLNCENGEIINRSKISKIGIGRAVVDHAGEKIAITQLNGRIAVVSLKDMSPLWNSETTLSFSPVFSNDGRYLVNFIGDENSTIDILHADTGKIRMKLDKRRGLIGATFSNDDRILYTWGMQGTIQAWDVEGGKLIWERLLTTCISRNT